VAGFHRNRWQVWIGIRFIPATHSGLGWQVIIGIPALRLAGFHRNQWQVWTGIFSWILKFKEVVFFLSKEIKW